jgi:neuroligin
MMSGSGLVPTSLVGEPARYAALVAHHVNCSVDLPHSHLLKCLRERNLKDLISLPIYFPDFTIAFGPSVDGVVIGWININLI